VCPGARTSKRPAQRSARPTDESGFQRIPAAERPAAFGGVSGECSSEGSGKGRRKGSGEGSGRRQGCNEGGIREFSQGSRGKTRGGQSFSGAARPFDTLLTKARAGNAPPENLPPGKAGLIVATLRIDGIVHSPNGMIAIVSNSQQRVYFLREGDKLYDGSVNKIALDAISFTEIGKDAFGKPLERAVTKRLYPSPGEQQ